MNYCVAPNIAAESSVPSAENNTCLKAYSQLRRGDRIESYGVTKAPRQYWVVKDPQVEGDRVRLILHPVSPSGGIEFSKATISETKKFGCWFASDRVVTVNPPLKLQEQVKAPVAVKQRKGNWQWVADVQRCILSCLTPGDSPRTWREVRDLVRDEAELEVSPASIQEQLKVLWNEGVICRNHRSNSQIYWVRPFKVGDRVIELRNTKSERYAVIESFLDEKPVLRLDDGRVVLSSINLLSHTNIQGGQQCSA